jgi:plasmid maintenance system antidote protein VapI
MSPTLSKARRRLLPNPNPGEILAEGSLKPMKSSQIALERAIAVPSRRINEITLGKRNCCKHRSTLGALFQYFGRFLYRATD